MVIADAASRISHYTTPDQICICWQCISASLDTSSLRLNQKTALLKRTHKARVEADMEASSSCAEFVN